MTSRNWKLEQETVNKLNNILGEEADYYYTNGVYIAEMGLEDRKTDITYETAIIYINGDKTKVVYCDTDAVCASLEGREEVYYTQHGDEVVESELLQYMQEV